MAREEPSCHSLLVAVTGSTPIPPDLERVMREWERRRPQRSTVLPILPAGASPDTILPTPLDRLIVLFNAGPIEMLVPDVLRAAGIGGGEHRLFISYRRVDAQDLAEQLHEGFTEAGFEVFLDRFRGTPGRPFPRVLAEELADKGLVLVLESLAVTSSPWTLAEVAFARALRLGLLAVAMPDSSPFRTIPTNDRWSPHASTWRTAATRGPTLTDAACREVVAFVRERYAEQVLVRQLYLENLLHRALARNGLRADSVGGGSFRISGGADYVVQLSRRPPRVGELRRAAEASRTPLAYPVVVGAHRYLAPGEAADLEWLSREVGASLRSEGLLPQVAAAIAAGRVPP